MTKEDPYIDPIYSIWPPSPTYNRTHNIHVSPVHLNETNGGYPSLSRTLPIRIHPNELTDQM